jgi:hypothetical protein
MAAGVVVTSDLSASALVQRQQPLASVKHRPRSTSDPMATHRYGPVLCLVADHADPTGTWHLLATTSKFANTGKNGMPITSICPRIL